MYIILLVFLFWIICGFVSYNWQQYLYIKDFGRRSSIKFLHFAYGPFALFATFTVDYLKLWKL